MDPAGITAVVVESGRFVVMDGQLAFCALQVGAETLACWSAGDTQELVQQLLQALQQRML